MKKYFFSTILFLAFAGQALCQYSEEHRIDSLKIDSLKNRLSLVKDSSKVDCLNQIAVAYLYIFPTQADSVYHYAAKANEAATAIGYKKGKSYALLNLTSVEIPKLNITAAKKQLKDAIAIGEAINDYDILMLISLKAKS